MNRIDRINRVRRLDRTLPTSRFPADVAAILALEPDVYFDLRFTSLPGIGQILWQDAARTTEVDTAGQAIGSARNLGSLGGYAESSGTQRPLWSPSAGASFDGIDDRLKIASAPVAQPLTHVLFVSDWRYDGDTGYAIDSEDSTAAFRHRAGMGSAASGFPDGLLLVFQGATSRFNWGLPAGDSVGRSRMVWRADGASSVQDWSGDWAYTTGTFSAGANSHSGLTLGALSSDASYGEIAVLGYARFPDGLTAGQIATLPGVL